MKTLFSADPLARKRTVWHQDLDGTVRLEKAQDCEPILQHVKARRENYKRDELAYVGEIPMQVLGEMMADGRITPDCDLREVRKWFNTPMGREFNASPWKTL